MQQDYAESFLRSGIIEAKSGNRAAARRYLERAIYASSNSRHETMAEAWFWLAEVTDDQHEKRQALENALSHDLQHARARRALAILDGKIKAAELVDPDRLATLPTSHATIQVEAERFMCPKCGGRMSFAADGQSLACDFCTRHEQVLPGPAVIAEEDFLVTMHSLRGHITPMAQQVFQCQGCGAEFLLPPARISANCLYCASPHVVTLERRAGMIAPDALIPHTLEKRKISALLTEWARDHSMQAPPLLDQLQGLYLPAWSFAMGGEIRYTARLYETQEDDDFDSPQWLAMKSRTVQESFPVQPEHVTVPATRKLARKLSRLLPTYDFEALKAYDPRYLADWPAEVYDVTVGNASLEARSQAFQHVKRELNEHSPSLRITSASSAGMTVESFRLILLPVWLTRICGKESDEVMLINGQNGALAEQAGKEKGLFDWLADLLEG